MPVQDSACCRICTSMDQCNVAIVLDANDGLEVRVSKTEEDDRGGPT